jgi:asparagine synthase (glutamine-hydrolysing)
MIGFDMLDSLLSMNDKQYHRGPDDSGYYYDKTERVGLTMRRLSILDISDGHQPMFNQDRSICIVYNGEIVNSPELRKIIERDGTVFSTGHSDTEVLLKLYERYQFGMLEHLNGMFSFVIYDKSRRIIFGARDHFGIKPLYYRLENQGLLFSSELKAMKTFPNLRWVIDKQSLFHYMSFQCVPSPGTIYEGVCKLCPGEYFTYTLHDRKFELKKYWSASSTTVSTSSYSYDSSYVIDRIRYGLRDAVRRWMLSDVPVASSLSGGIDSAVITGLMSEISHAPIRTYTLGYDGHQDVDERRMARLLANRWGTEHVEIVIGENDLIRELNAMVYSLDEPYGGGLPSWFVYKGMSGEVKACLTGTGGDELFGNYGKWRVYADPYYATRQFLGFLKKDIRWFSDWLKFPIGSRYSIYFRDYEKRGSLFVSSFFNDCIASESLIESLLLGSEQENLLDIPRVIDYRIQLPEEFLHMTDRFSMAHSIEARPPFLDRVLFEDLMSIPATIRIGKRILKQHLIEAFSDYIPDQLKMAPKKGFVLPLAHWIRSDLNCQIKELFDPAFLRHQAIFKEDIYMTLITPHLEGKFDNSGKIWTLFMFQLWYRENMIG